MAKTILGIDIGSDNLKLALVSRGRVKKTVTLSMPKNLLQNGVIVSDESMGELIRTAIRENGLRARNAAVVLPNEMVFVKNVTMPRMNAEQISYNLPYEFRDYITGEIQNYVFDYAVLTEEEDQKSREKREKKQAKELAKAKKKALKKRKLGEPFPESEPEAEAESASAPEETGEAEPETIELMAAGTARSTLDHTRGILRKAGLKLKMAAPAVCAYIPLIRRQEGVGAEKGEYCILDLGHQAIRMYIFQGERHIVTRVLEVGLSRLDEVLEELFNVDVHLAHTYLTTNYENCQRSEECMNTYGSIGVELMRALNFYHFSNPGSALTDVWLCGGGAAIEPLCEAIAEALDMNLYRAQDLVPGGADIKDCNGYVQAIGIALA